MLLKDEIDIVCSTRDVFAWLNRFDHYYLLWHPDHITCNYIKGSSLEVGAVLLCQEYLHGKPHKFRMTVVRVDSGSRVDYRIGPGMSGSFKVQPAGDGVRFTAELRLGWYLPGLVGIQDAVLRRLFGWRIKALFQHMNEEGRYLKAMIEAGVIHKNVADGAIGRAEEALSVSRYPQSG